MSKKNKSFSPSLKLAVLAAALAGAYSACALAEDTVANSAKAVLDHKDLTYAGVTVYGTIDVGYLYQNHGAPYDISYAPIANYLATSKNNQGTVSTLAPNGWSTSKLGLKGDVPLQENLSAVFKLETGFNPLTGQLLDGPKSLLSVNGLTAQQAANAPANGDSSRAGQIFQGAAYFGLKSATYGTLTFGRQNGILFDATAKYDPTGNASAFSLFGASSTYGSGIGNTQQARLDDSVRYDAKFGPVRVGAQYQFSGQGNLGEGYQANIGTDFAGFSVDGYIGHKNSAVSYAASSALPLGSQQLNATISDNTAWAIAASYKYDQFKAFAGYNFVRYENPNTPVANGASGPFGYTIAVATNNAYTNNKEIRIGWLGAKYSPTEKLDFTLAWYNVGQNSYKGNGCTNNSAASCEGSLNAYGATVLYKAFPRLNLYAGLLNSSVDGGLANGVTHTSVTSFMTGTTFSF